MIEKLAKEKFWELYEKASPALKDIIFSADTSEVIWNICKLTDIDETSVVAEHIKKTLLGLLHPNKLKTELQKELNLDDKTTEKLGLYIQQYILNPVMDELMDLYETEKPKEEIKTQEKKQEKLEEDRYREELS